MIYGVCKLYIIIMCATHVCNVFVYVFCITIRHVVDFLYVGFKLKLSLYSWILYIFYMVYTESSFSRKVPFQENLFVKKNHLLEKSITRKSYWQTTQWPENSLARIFVFLMLYTPIVFSGNWVFYSIWDFWQNESDVLFFWQMVILRFWHIWFGVLGVRQLWMNHEIFIP